MTNGRRDFLSSLLAAGTIPAFVPVLRAAGEIVEQRGGQSPAFEPDQATYDFWNGFLSNKTTPATKVPTGRTRGEDAEPFFFHNGKQGLQPAALIPASDLIAEGDVSVSLNVAGFKPSDIDRAKCENLQSAQLRLDFLQDVPIVDVMDTMAWTAVAVLRPDRQKKLPPLQNLSFDPSATWKKMQNIVLPKGQGRWSINFYAERADGFLSKLLQVLNNEVGRFAPALGLPGIGTTALQSFNQVYGYFHSKPEYLLQSNPVQVFGTADASKQGTSSHGLPLRTGNYVVVPVGQASVLTDDRLKTLELQQGYLVPKGTAPVDVHKAAADLEDLKSVTYATLDVTVKPAQLPCPGK